jgi:hypothetical protein
MTPRTSIARLADDAPVARPGSWPSWSAPGVNDFRPCPPEPPRIVGECPDCGMLTSATRVWGFACQHARCPIAVQDAEPTPSVSTGAGRTGSAHLPTASQITVAEPARRRNPVATGEARGPQTVDREAAGGLDPTTYIDDTPVMRRVHAAIEAEARATASAVTEADARIRALEAEGF